jgi:hypothetical protein
MWMACGRMEEREGKEENGEGNVGKGWHGGSAARTELPTESGTGGRAMESGGGR